MTIEKLYRILSAILMPITFILAFFTMPFALMSFSNPSTLIGVFIFVCVIIYIVKSVSFYRRNIVTDLPAKANTRDWIRVNSFVTIFFILEIFASAFAVFFKPEEIIKMFQPMLNAFQEAQGGEGVQITVESLYNALRNLMIFFTIYGIIMGVHIFCSYKLLKKYKNLLSL